MLYAAYFILIFSQIFAFRTAGIGPTQRALYLDKAAIIRIVVSIIIFLLLIALYLLGLLPPLKMFWLSKSQKVVWIYILLLAISSLWSRLFLTGIFRIFQLSVATLLVWFLILSWENNKIGDLVWRLSLPVLISAIMNGLFAPGKLEVYYAGYIGYLYRFKENACGHVAAIATAHGLIQCIWRPINLSYRKAVIRFLLPLMGLILFQSATGWVLLQIAVILIILKSRQIYIAFLATSAILGMLMFSGPLKIASMGLAGKDPQNISTLTGRMDLYPIAISFALESPIWGHGFLADSLLGQFDRRVGWLPQNAHNGYLSAFLNFGIIGLAFLIIAFTIIYRGLRVPRCRGVSSKSSLYFGLQLIFIMLAVGNIVESWIGDKFTLLWPYFVGLAIVPVITARTSPKYSSRCNNIARAR